MLLECVDMRLIKLLIVNDFHIWLWIWNIGRTTSRARVSQHDAQISRFGHHKTTFLFFLIFFIGIKSLQGFPWSSSDEHSMVDFVKNYRK